MDYFSLQVASVIAVLVAILAWTIHRKLAGLTRQIEALATSIAETASIAPQVRDTREGIARVAAEMGEIRGRLAAVSDAQSKSVEAMAALNALVPSQIGIAFQGVTESLATTLASGRTETAETLGRMRSEITTALRAGVESQERKLGELRSSLDLKLSEIITRTTEGSQALNNTARATTATVTDRLAELKSTVDAALKEELGSIRQENSAKLEEMRRTVDEKLHATLEQRLGESFKLVSDRLELVHRGLGEMQVLAAGVGDLKKILTNVKTRGTYGEVQLGSLLEQILTNEQFARNVAPIPGRGGVVEFAIKLPGGRDGTPVWLPIDAKFPVEDYQRLGDAQDRADAPAVEEAGRALEARLRSEAKQIRDKYLEPPYTTDFGVMFLPTEGLYAEALRRPGLTEWAQRECKVVIAGPTTLAALLNSLQMGFRTLAIEKRSSEVWTLLGTVKSEFGKFGDALAHTKKKLAEATNSIETAERRNRVLVRKLDDVDALPPSEPALVLDLPTAPELGTLEDDDATVPR